MCSFSGRWSTPTLYSKRVLEQTIFIVFFFKKKDVLRLLDTLLFIPSFSVVISGWIHVWQYEVYEVSLDTDCHKPYTAIRPPEFHPLSSSLYFFLVVLREYMNQKREREMETTLLKKQKQTKNIKKYMGKKQKQTEKRHTCKTRK